MMSKIKSKRKYKRKYKKLLIYKKVANSDFFIYCGKKLISREV